MNKGWLLAAAVTILAAASASGASDGGEDKRSGRILRRRKKVARSEELLVLPSHLRPVSYLPPTVAAPTPVAFVPWAPARPPPYEPTKQSEASTFMLCWCDLNEKKSPFQCEFCRSSIAELSRSAQAAAERIGQAEEWNHRLREQLETVASVCAVVAGP